MFQLIISHTVNGRSPATMSAAWRGQKGCENEFFLWRIVNCGVCREGLIYAVVQHSLKC